MAKNIGKNISKILSGKYSQKPLDHAKYLQDVLKTSSKRVTQKTIEVTGDLIGNKTANKVTRVSKNSQQNNSGIVTNKHDKGIPKERYVSPEERQEIILINWV